MVACRLSQSLGRPFGRESGSQADSERFRGFPLCISGLCLYRRWPGGFNKPPGLENSIQLYALHKPMLGIGGWRRGVIGFSGGSCPIFLSRLTRNLRFAIRAVTSLWLMDILHDDRIGCQFNGRVFLPGPGIPEAENRCSRIGCHEGEGVASPRAGEYRF